MKLSEIQGERCIDVIAELIVPISRIAKDPNAKAAFAPKKPPKGISAQDFFMQRLAEAMPPLLKDHKEDFIEVMATIEGVTPLEYAESLNMGKLVRDVMSILTDQELVGFLTL